MGGRVVELDRERKPPKGRLPHRKSHPPATATEFIQSRTFWNRYLFELLGSPSLVEAGRACAFPCDAAGHVDMDALSDTARENYLYARTVVGREFSIPAVISR